MAISATAAALLTFAAHSVSAQQDAEVAWGLTLENDKWGDGADRHYTHGTRLERSSSATPAWIRKIAAPLRCLACTTPEEFELEFGQHIYTPEDTRSTAVVVHDRPYAGWAYGAVTLAGERASANGGHTTVDAIRLEIGVVGPAALAERTQQLLHREKDVALARGWDNQLDNELGAAIVYERGLRKLVGAAGARISHDVTPYFGGALGNVQTHIDAGVRWRTGRNLQGARATAAQGWHWFADFNLRRVGRNLLLDGNSDGASHSVEKEPVVARVATGIEYRTARFSLSVSRERRGREFSGQREPDEYGAISFSVAP